MSTRILATAPRLAALYAKALTTSRGRSGTGVPDVTYTLPRYSIDPGHLAEYQRRCGFRVNDELPPTYLHVLAFPLAVSVMVEPDFPFPMIGLVHVENSSQWTRPVTMSETVALRARAEELRPHRTGRQVDLVAEARVDDELVWTGRSTYLRREGNSQGSKAAKADTEVPTAEAIWRVPSDAGRTYAAVSGDYNPIHVNSLAAKALGFPRAIAHGMWVAARALAAVEPAVPPAGRYDVTFKTPVLLPSTVGYSATRSAPNSWKISVFAARSGKPHLSADVAPA